MSTVALGSDVRSTSTITLPKKGKLVAGRVELKVAYSCPSATRAEDALLWLYSSQQEPAFAAGDTAVRVVCDGKRHTYRASLGPNIGEEAYAAGTVFVEAYLGESADTVHAYDSANVSVR